MVNKISIQLDKLRLGYTHGAKTEVVIEQASATFYQGDLVGIVGLNGAGKSSLLKSLSGLLKPLSGEIHIASHNIQSLSLSDLSKQLSILLTERISGFNLSVYDLVASGQMPYTNAFHQLKEEHKQCIDAAIKTVGLENQQYKLLNALSDGLFQKALIAKSLAQQTPIMLLDEPTAYLDYASKHHLFELLQQLCLTEHKCILVSSHDLDVLLKYCSKILIIHNKHVELLPISAISNNSAFIELAGGYL